MEAFPTPVGMNRVLPQPNLPVMGVPHTRGVLFSLTARSMRFSSFLTSASDMLFSSCAISWSMAIISACKSWILKVGKSLFYLAFCQDISVNFIFTVVFKVDTNLASSASSR